MATATFTAETLLKAALRFPHTFATYRSGGRWRPYEFQKFISRTVRDAIEAGDGRVIVNAPPQRGKSRIGSVEVPIWFLKHWPHKTVMLGSHDDTLANGFGRMVRNECVQNPLVGVDLAPDSRAKDIWHTPQGGGMITGGVETGFTGHGGDLIVIDDPYPNWAAAQSATFRRKVTEWYDGTIHNRKRPGATIVVVNHRMHVDDLTGHLLKKWGTEKWEHVRLPEIAEVNDPLGRKPGDVICPELFSAESVERDRLGTPPEKWAALMQQDPMQGGAGNVYSHFGARNISSDVDLVDHLPLCLALDFNINPGMHGEIGQYDPIRDHFTVTDELHGPRMSLRDCLNALVRWWEKGGGFRWPELHVFGDASGGAAKIDDGDSMWDVVTERLKLTGVPFRIRVPGRNPPIVDSVMCVNDALQDVAGASHYTVHPRCERLVVDLREQRANEYGQIEKSDQKIGHAGDTQRYWVHYLRPVGGACEMPASRYVLG